MSESLQSDIELRLHPLTIFYRAVISSPQLLIIIYFTIIRGDIGQLITVIVIIVWAIMAFPFIFLNYYFFTYIITSKEIIIHSGVFSRRQRNIPIEKIQNVEITQNFLQRILSLAKVSIETAGESGVEANLEFVSNKRAEHIRETIKNYQKKIESDELIEKPEGTIEQVTIAKGQKNLVYAMSIKDNIIYGALRFRPILFAIVIWLLGLAQQFYLIPDYWEMDYSDIQSFIASINQWELIILLFLFVLLASILSILLDIILTTNQYYGFRLYKEMDKLQAEHGLLSKRKFTIPLKKLQMLVMRSNFVMRKFDYWGFLLETAGFKEAQKGSKTVIPIAKKNTILELIDKVLNIEFIEEFEQVSRKTIRRAMVRYVLILGPVLAILSYFSLYFLWLLIFAPFLYFGAVLMYKNRGYKIYSDKLQIKQGYFFQKISIAPIDKIQSVNVVETFFQQRLGLATIHIDTAASQLISDASIIDLDKDIAHKLAEETIEAFRLYRKKKQQY